MTVPHRCTSVARYDFSAAGVARLCSTGAVPKLAKRSITFASLRAVWRARPSLSDASLGKPFGAHIACHADTSKPGSALLSSVGRSGSGDTLDLVVTG